MTIRQWCSTGLIQCQMCEYHRFGRRVLDGNFHVALGDRLGDVAGVIEQMNDDHVHGSLVSDVCLVTDRAVRSFTPNK